MRRGVIVLIGLVTVIVFVVLIVVIVRSGGSKTAPDKIVLKVWSPFDEGEVYQALAKPFLVDKPNVSLEFKYVQATDAKDYEAKVVDAIASGNGPDIWLIRNDWLPKHQPKLSASPLKWAKGKETEADALAAVFTAPVVKQNSIDDKLYSLPFSVDSLALYVNTSVINTVRTEIDEAGGDSTVFDTYPTTWAEVEKWSRTITKRSGGTITRSGLAIGTVSNTYAAVDVFNALLTEKGGQLFNPSDKSVALNLSQLVDGQTIFPGQQALDFYGSFADPSHPNYDWGTSLGDQTKAFVDGKVAMMVGYSSLATDIRRLDKNFDKAVIIPLPQFKEQITPTDKRFDYATYWTHVVLKNSPNSATAWGLLQLITSSTESLRAYHTQTGKLDLTSLHDGAFSQGAIDFQDQSIFSAQIFDSTTMYKPEWQAVDEIVQDMISQRLAGQSVQTAVDSAVSSLKKLSQ